MARGKHDDWLVPAILFAGVVSFFLGKNALQGGAVVAPARPRSVKPT